MSTGVTTNETAERVSSKSRRRLLVIVPAFNEGPRVVGVVEKVHREHPQADVLVVDDGSSDDTEARSLDAGAIVARHPFNIGYGSALETGYQFAIQGHYDYVAQLDGDGQHDPISLADVLAPTLEDAADVTIGSRFLIPSSYQAPWSRKLGRHLFSWLASRLTGRRITDPTSGLWAMNRKATETLTGGQLPHDYPDADVLIDLHHAGLRLTEVPVVMHPSPRGSSMHDGAKPLYYVFKMLLSMFLAMLGRRPKSV